MRQGIHVNCAIDAAHCGRLKSPKIRPGRLNHGQSNGRKANCNQAMVLHLGEVKVMTSTMLAVARTKRTLAISMIQMTAAIFLCVSASARLYLSDS